MEEGPAQEESPDPMGREGWSLGTAMTGTSLVGGAGITGESAHETALQNGHHWPGIELCEGRFQTSIKEDIC